MGEKMTLFSISDDMLELYKMATDTDIDPQVFADTLEGLKGMLEVKACGYVNVIKQLEMEQKEIQNQRDNETRILVAQIQAQANIDSSVARASGFTESPQTPISEKDRLQLQQQIQENKEKNQLEREKLQLEREKIKSQERIAKNKGVS